MAASAQSLADLNAAVARASGGRLTATIRGAADTRIAGLAPLAEAGPADLAFLANPRYRNDALASRAGAIVLSPASADQLAAAGGVLPALVVVDQPYAWFAHAAQLLHPEPRAVPGVAATASVDASAQVDPGACIEAGAVVGARCIVHSGAVIGADGFGFAPLDGRWVKIPQTGAVVIGDDVEVGANTTIDRGTMGDTVIEEGVKLDNQIQVAHNCVIGAHTVIAGCVGIAGSARIGRHCQIGGAAMIAGHISIADGCAIGPGTLVASSLTERGHYTGFFPLMKNRDWERTAAIIRRLDELRDRLRQLEARQRQGQNT